MAVNIHGIGRREIMLNAHTLAFTKLVQDKPLHPLRYFFKLFVALLSLHIFGLLKLA